MELLIPVLTFAVVLMWFWEGYMVHMYSKLQKGFKEYQDTVRSDINRLFLELNGLAEKNMDLQKTLSDMRQSNMHSQMLMWDQFCSNLKFDTLVKYLGLEFEAERPSMQKKGKRCK